MRVDPSREAAVVFIVRIQRLCVNFFYGDPIAKDACGLSGSLLLNFIDLNINLIISKTLFDMVKRKGPESGSRGTPGICFESGIVYQEIDSLVIG